MKLHTLIVSMILFTTSIVVCAQPVTQEITVSNLGAYGFTPRDGTFSPIILPQYAAGQALGGHLRNFFVFDLSTISGLILTAEFVVFNPADNEPGIPTCGFSEFNDDPTEDFQLVDVTTSISTLIDGTDKELSYADIGDGVIYGERTFSAADNGKFIRMSLNNNAVAAMNRSPNGIFAMGGHVTTIRDVVDYDLIFFCSDINDPSRVPELPKLILTFAPDSDNDGVLDDVDNCPNNINPGQGNADGDSRGGACDNNDNTSDEPFNCTIDNSM